MNFENFLDILILSAILAVVFFLIANLAGCNTYYKQTSGERDIVGIQLPDSDISLELLSHKDGSSIKVSEPSLIYHRYQIATTNEYFYLISANSLIEGDLVIVPTNSIHELFSTNSIKSK